MPPQPDPIAAAVPVARKNPKKRPKRVGTTASNPDVDRGVDGSSFKLCNSTIALQSQAVARGYHALLDEALLEIKGIVARVAEASGYPYKTVEDDILATHTARIRKRQVCGWNVFSSDRLAEMNSGQYSFSNSCHYFFTQKFTAKPTGQREYLTEDSLDLISADWAEMTPEQKKPYKERATTVEQLKVKAHSEGKEAKNLDDARNTDAVRTINEVDKMVHSIALAGSFC
jgi:hypothetical protein